MRALAAKQITHDQHGNEIAIHLVDAYITVHAPIESQGRYNVHLDGEIFVHSSLHRAKNAIRRHFGIESRKQLRWEEGVR